MLIDRSVHPLTGEAELTARLLHLIDEFNGRHVLVVGDLIADEFIYGEVARVSREAPVLILKYDATQVIPGGAGNAAGNVAALGGRAALAGIVGTDPEGRRLLASVPREVDRRTIVRSRPYRTPVKTRILAGGTHSAKQQVVRIDRENRLAALRRGQPHVRRTSRSGTGRNATPWSCPTTDRVSSRPRSPLPSSRRSARRPRRRPAPVLLDSRFRLLDYRGLTACTPERIRGRARAWHPDRR